MSDTRHPRKLVVLVQLESVFDAENLGSKLARHGFQPAKALVAENSTALFAGYALMAANSDPGDVHLAKNPNPTFVTAAESLLYNLGLTKREDTAILAVVANPAENIENNDTRNGITDRKESEASQERRRSFAKGNSSPIMALCRVKVTGRGGTRLVRIVAASSLDNYFANPSQWEWFDPDWIDDFPTD